jgi:hypothetical protein
MFRSLLFPSAQPLLAASCATQSIHAVRHNLSPSPDHYLQHHLIQSMRTRISSGRARERSIAAFKQSLAELDRFEDRRHLCNLEKCHRKYQTLLVRHAIWTRGGGGGCTLAPICWSGTTDSRRSERKQLTDVWTTVTVA